MKTAVRIRYGTPADAQRLARFAAQTFTVRIETSITQMTSRTTSLSISASPPLPTCCAIRLGTTPLNLPKRARRSRATRWSVGRNRRAVATGPLPINLWRLYLDEAFIGKGLGARLLAEVHAEAVRQGAATPGSGVRPQRAGGAVL